MALQAGFIEEVTWATEWVEQYRSCQECEQDRPMQWAEPQIHLPVPSQYFENISVDFAEVDGQQFLITTDWRSGWFSTYKESSTSAKCTIQVLRDHFADARMPALLPTDNGASFYLSRTQRLLQNMGSKVFHIITMLCTKQYLGRKRSEASQSSIEKVLRNGHLDGEKWTKGLL